MEEELTSTKGTFGVRLGDSLTTGDVSFHSFRYNFAPDSLDKSRGALQVSSTGEASLSFASQSKGREEHLFKGPVAPCKDNDFLLVYDPDTREFVLEKLASVTALRNIRTTKRRAPSADDLPDEEEPSARPAGSSSKGKIIMPVAGALHARAVDETRDESEETFSDLEECLLQDLQGSSTHHQHHPK